MIISYSRKNVKNTASSYSDSLLQNQKSKMNNNENNTYSYSDNVPINPLDIADGLKEQLIKYGFTTEVLSSIPSSELAEFLGIDKYIAQLISSAAVKLSNDSYAPCYRSNTNLQTGNSIT
ncbi:MAG TPA: hypothetical protein VE544_10605 [Nitrososphaeraceae archaeon]|nr:hypothetical protein [Nitrososphaeraceae archaeon]